MLCLPDRWRTYGKLRDLVDGEYQTGVDVPYYAQFASPELIDDYIHRHYDGTQDPQWRLFGANDPAEYAFWAPRVCALACLKMAVGAFYLGRQLSLWQLVKEGLEANGYTVRDPRGNWVDLGWHYPALVHLAARYGLQAVGRGYVSSSAVCQYIHEGWLVAATVTPELGERQPVGKRYGGHVVLVYGFAWKNGGPARYILHNPSGRFPELQAGASIPADHFKASFAHRLIALRPSS